MWSREPLEQARLGDPTGAGLLQRVAVIANEASTFRGALQVAVDEVCAYTGWPVGHAYLAEDGPDPLKPTDLWHLDQPERFEPFRAVTSVTPLQLGSGLPGRVLEVGGAVWIDDASTDKNFPRNRCPQDIVVRSGFAFPVLASHSIVAVLEFYSDGHQPRDDRLLELVANVGTQLGRVAEREFSATALLAQAEEMRQLIELAHDAFVSIDQDGTITGWNIAAESMFGWSRDEAIGRLMAETIVPPRHRDAHRRGLKRYLETRTAHVLNQSIELTALDRAGREFAIELAIWPVGTGARLTFAAFIRDISRRKAAEETVARLASIVESSDDAMIGKGLDGTILSWNKGAEHIYGYTAAEAVGQSTQMLVPHEDADEWTAIMHRIGKGETVHHHEAVRRRKDGRLIDVSLTISPIRDTSGKVVGAATVARDVSVQRRAEDNLRQSERRLREAQQIVHIGSWEWDVERDAITWSDQLFRNFEIRKEDFVPSFQGYLARIHPGDRESVRSTIFAALENHQSFEFKHRVVLPGFRERIHLCTGDVFVEDGKAVRMAGTSQDITERRQAEESLQSALARESKMVAQLKELDVAKTNFVSSVSHELRTPLTSIIGYLELLNGDAGSLTAEQREFLDVIRRNSSRLLSLIEDILTISRLESGTFHLSIAATRVRPIVEAVLKSVVPAATARSIDLEANVAERIGSVMGDAEQLERVLSNLLTNAIKFTPNGGSVRFRAERRDGNVVFQVIDKGIGISEEDLSRLFSRFFRSANAVARGVPGTGLGLAIVKAIVEDHGGSIDVESTLREGTTVTVQLPVAHRRRLTEEGKKEVAANGSRSRR